MQSNNSVIQLRNRMTGEGVSKSKRDNTNKLDIIANKYAIKTAESRTKFLVSAVFWAKKNRQALDKLGGRFRKESAIMIFSLRYM